MKGPTYTLTPYGFGKTTTLTPCGFGTTYGTEGSDDKIYEYEEWFDEKDPKLITRYVHGHGIRKVERFAEKIKINGQTMIVSIKRLSFLIVDDLAHGPVPFSGPDRWHYAVYGKNNPWPVKGSGLIHHYRVNWPRRDKMHRVITTFAT
jgi:hypothetical protein